MMSERQARFREEYRSRIVGWYNGYFHVAVIYALGAASLWYVLAHVRDVAWWEWLTIPIVAFLANVFEWAVHRYVMHRPIASRGTRAVYTRHTLNHHQFFSDQEMRFRDHRDWRVTVFPPFALVTFIMMSAAPALVVGALVSANAGWLLIATTVGMYLVYEFMHFCCHVAENRFVRHAPFVNTLRRHHFAHHNTRLMMRTNMNLTFPIADWMFGTSDLDRGLLGHLFNGYDGRHRKATLPVEPVAPGARDPGPALTV
jgi:hypothetical protein